MLSPVLITAPASDAVTLEEAKLHLRVDHSHEDTLIQSLINAAVGHLDGYTGALGRCLVTQTWSQEYENPVADLVLPLGPVQSVSSVTSDEGAFSDYTVKKDGRGPFLRLDEGAAWPAGPLVVEFVAGEAEIPAPLKAAILLHVGTLYENRETLAESFTPTRAYEALTAPYRSLGC